MLGSDDAVGELLNLVGEGGRGEERETVVYWCLVLVSDDAVNELLDFGRYLGETCEFPRPEVTSHPNFVSQ